MTFRISPGVYPQLQDLTERVPNFPSNVGAICFASLRGPTDLRLVTSTVQFAELYGGPTPFDPVTPGNGHDTANLFLEEANSLYCQRIVNDAMYGLGALVLNGGSGYTVVPNVTIDPPISGTVAEAQAQVLGGRVVQIIITNPGSGYTSPPTVTIDAPGSGISAVATSTVSNGQVSLINLVDYVRASQGTSNSFSQTTANSLASNFNFQDYQTPLFYVLAENPGTWSNEVQISINQVNLGVTKQSQLTFDGPVLRGQQISYVHDSQIRTISFSRNSDNTLQDLANDIITATNAQATVVSIVSGEVGSVEITNPGSGYTDPPSVTFGGGDGNGAQATATVENGIVTGITITNGGQDYTMAPTITIDAPPAAVTATADAVVDSGVITGITLTNNGGSGYTIAPTVTVSESGASGAVLEAVAENGRIVRINVVSGGTGYTNGATVTIADPPSVETATATVEINTADDFTINISGVESTNDIDIGDFSVTGPGTNPTVTLTVSRDNIPTDRTFTFQVFEGATDRPVESWQVSLNEQVDGFGSQREISYQVNEGPARSNRVRIIKAADSENHNIFNHVGRRRLSGGDNGLAPTDQSLVQGWRRFENTQEVTVHRLMSAGYTSPVVLQTIANVALNRRDAFAILDLPIDQQQARNAALFRNNELNINSSYAALYGPDIEIFDEFTGRRRFVPPSGAVGASFAFTSRTAELWFAPAGLTRGLVNRALGLRYNYNEGDRDTLALAQINPIIRLGASISIWGESTLQVNPSALRSVPVRLLMTSIEVSVADSLNSNTFDLNDPQTRFAIRSRIEDFLLPIRRGRGIEEYRVVCDETNNPPEIRDQQILNVDIYVKPVLAALYIRLTSILTRSSANFDEIIERRAA